MRAHIQETIQDLSREIGRLQGAILTLQRFEDGVLQTGNPVDGNGAQDKGPVAIKGRPRKSKTSALSDYVRRGGGRQTHGKSGAKDTTRRGQELGGMLEA